MKKATMTFFYLGILLAAVSILAVKVSTRVERQQPATVQALAAMGIE